MAKINEKSNKTPGKSFMTAMTSDYDELLTTIAVPKSEFHTKSQSQIVGLAQK